MATSGQYPSGKVSGTGKDPRASTAIPGTGKPAPQKPGAPRRSNTRMIIIGGVIFLVFLVVANVIFLATQREAVKVEQGYDQQTAAGDMQSKLVELKGDLGKFKQQIEAQKKEVDKLKAELLQTKSQVDFLSAREMGRH